MPCTVSLVALLIIRDDHLMKLLHGPISALQVVSHGLGLRASSAAVVGNLQIEFKI